VRHELTMHVVFRSSSRPFRAASITGTRPRVRSTS